MIRFTWFPRLTSLLSSLSTSATTLVCIFFSILNGSQARQKNSTLKDCRKYRSVQLLKYILFLLPIKIKKQTALHEIFFNFQCKCAAGDSTPYFKINAPLFLYPLNFKEYLNPQIRINKMENKFRLLPQSFRINLKYRFSHPLLRPVRAFSLARSFVEFFLKSVYPSMVGKLFQMKGLQITGKYIFKSKNIIKTFLLMHPGTLQNLFEHPV